VLAHTAHFRKSNLHKLSSVKVGIFVEESKSSAAAFLHSENEEFGAADFFRVQGARLKKE